MRVYDTQAYQQPRYCRTAAVHRAAEFIISRGEHQQRGLFTYRD
jgi:hypothetical protein